MLHYRFGHHREASQAIFETVRIAQQRNDHACLTHALSLQVRLVQQKGKSVTAKQLLDHCVARTHDRSSNDAGNGVDDSHSLPEVDAQMWVAVAKHFLEHVVKKTDTTDPRHVWMALGKAMRSSALHRVQGATSGWLMRGAVWDRFGRRWLASLGSQLHYRFYASVSSREDVTVALCNMANHQESDDATEAILEFAREQQHSTSAVGFTEIAAIVHFRRAIERGDYAAATRAADQMFALRPDANDNFQFYVEACFMSAQLKLHAADLYQAYTEANELVALCESHAQQIQLPRFLLFIAKIHEAGGSLASALPYVLRALTLCRNFHLDTLLADATLVLARIHVELGSPQLGLGAIRSVLPHIFENCVQRVRAEAFVGMAECLCAMSPRQRSDHTAPSECSHASPAEHIALDQAVRYLHAARQTCELASVRADRGFVRLLRRTFHLLALVYDQLGQPCNRNRAAEQFCKLDTRLTTKNPVDR